MRRAGLGCLILLALSAVPGATAALHEVRVVETHDMDAWAFTPEQLAIQPGDTVRFIDEAPAGHTVTSDDAGFHEAFNGDHGDTITVTFDEAGTFRFYCRPHPWMETHIEVRATSQAGTQAPPSGSGQPAAETTPAPIAAAPLALLWVAARRRH